MICEKCGLPLLGTEIFCPQCGAGLAQAAQADEPIALSEDDQPQQASQPSNQATDTPTVPVEQAADGNPPAVGAVDVPLEVPYWQETAGAATTPDGAAARPATRARPSRLRSAARQQARLSGPLGLGLMAGCLVFFVIGLGLLGIVEGLRLRTSSQDQVATQHYDRGMAHMAKGEYDMAAAEFEFALKLRPNYPRAAQALTEARAKAAQEATPTVPEGRGQSSNLLAEGRAAYDSGAWDEAIAKLEALRSQDPNYEQAAVLRLLVGAYTNGGLKLVNEDRLEEAIRRFDQALALQPDNPDVQQQRHLATLYQGGLSTWGVDWREAIKNLSAVYALKPDYRDVTQRLQQAYILAGDSAGMQSAWCDAVQYYKAALDISTTPEVAAKRDDAAHRCASPGGVAGGTPAPSGTFVGAVAKYEPTQADWGRVYGRVLNARGEGVPGVKVKISAYDWSALTGTDGAGNYVFEALNKEITFTVTLVDVPVQPVDVKVKLGYASVTNFQEKP